MIIKNSMLYLPDHTFRKGTLQTEGDRIQCVCPGTEACADSACEEAVLDAQGGYVIPGLIDIHLHGCVGVDFCDASHESTAAMADYLLKNGITGFTPATMTISPEELDKVFTAASTYEDKKGARFLGIHMEGPFFCEKKKGAQAGEHLRLPDYDTFRHYQELSGNHITQVDVAPELPGALEFIKKASKELTVSLGHSAAGYEEASAGFAAGASHVTHLFNGMMPFAHRDPGLVGAAAELSDTKVEMICDGIHLHPSTIRSMFRLFGPERIMLISDSMMAAGMPDGQYSLGGQPVTVKDSKALLADGTIAGSAVNLMECVRRVVSFGIPLADAVRCASENQAKELGLFHEIGSLSTGKYANLVILNPDLTIQHVILEGEVVI